MTEHLWCIMTYCNVCGENVPVGVGASVRREWMSSTASVSSIYRNDTNSYTCPWKWLDTNVFNIDGHLQDEGVLLAMGEVQF